MANRKPPGGLKNPPAHRHGEDTEARRLCQLEVRRAEQNHLQSGGGSGTIIIQELFKVRRLEFAYGGAKHCDIRD